MNRVWVRGLALVDGHLVLSVDRPAPCTDLAARVVRWERQRAGPSVPIVASCWIKRIGGHWTLSW